MAGIWRPYRERRRLSRLGLARGFLIPATIAASMIAALALPTGARHGTGYKHLGRRDLLVSQRAHRLIDLVMESWQ